MDFWKKAILSFSLATGAVMLLGSVAINGDWITIIGAMCMLPVTMVLYSRHHRRYLNSPIKTQHKLIFLETMFWGFVVGPALVTFIYNIRDDQQQQHNAYKPLIVYVLGAVLVYASMALYIYFILQEGDEL